MMRALRASRRKRETRTPRCESRAHRIDTAFDEERGRGTAEPRAWPSRANGSAAKLQELLEADVKARMPCQARRLSTAGATPTDHCAHPGTPKDRRRIGGTGVRAAAMAVFDRFRSDRRRRGGFFFFLFGTRPPPPPLARGLIRSKRQLRERSGSSNRRTCLRFDPVYLFNSRIGVLTSRSVDTHDHAVDDCRRRDRRPLLVDMLRRLIRPVSPSIQRLELDGR